MALPKLFQRIFFHNNTTPALNEDNLNAMSKGLSDVDDRLIELAGTIMEDVPAIQHDLEILEPAIENIDANVARAEGAADDAEAEALKSEGYAVGTQDGVEVTSGEYYQNNAKYYAEIANPPIENTVDFTDVIAITDAINKAAKDVRLKVEAVQDLHGYNNPWVGGAGKNKLSPDKLAATGSENGVTRTNNGDGTLTVKNTATSSFTLTIADNVTLADGEYKVSFGTNIGIRVVGNSPTSGWVQLATSDVGVESDATFTASNTYTKYLIQARIVNGTNYNNVVKPMIRLATVSDATFEPYTNICPISGWDNAKVTRAGKNLFDGNFTLQKNISSTGAIVNNSRCAYTTNSVKTSGHNKATVSFNRAIYSVFIVEYDAYGNFIRRDDSSNNVSSFTATLSSNCGYIKVAFNYDSSTTVTDAIVNAINAQIEYGDTATAYEAPQVNVYTIDLNGTRYGGTLDVTTGTLTLTYSYEVYDGSTEEAWDGSGDEYYTNQIGNHKPKGKIIANKYRGVQVTQWAYLNDGDIGLHPTGKALHLKDTTPGNLTNFREALAVTPLEIVYELATPQTIQLTAAEVYLLYGYNTLFGDCGDISLIYDASGIIHIAEAKLDTETLKTIAAASSDFADFKARIAAL